MDFLAWVFGFFFGGLSHFFQALAAPSFWLAWVLEINATNISAPEVKESLVRFIYYGGSIEFLSAILSILLLLTGFGLFYRPFLWRIVHFSEFCSVGVGRFFAWAALIMVIQQICIIFLQRVFTVADFSLIVGTDILRRDVSWWSEMLKLYNAMLVCLCCAYTFIQKGHVRVDLIYSRLSYRGRRVVDMFGALFLMMPMAVICWLYGWFFMWRHLIIPKLSASDPLERLMLRARFVRWNVETIGFSPNGFDAYFLFKLLLVLFAGIIFLQSATFFYRSLLEFIENKYTGEADDRA